jgi:hypothetical protein
VAFVPHFVLRRSSRRSMVFPAIDALRCSMDLALQIPAVS